MGNIQEFTNKAGDSVLVNMANVCGFVPARAVGWFDSGRCMGVNVYFAESVMFCQGFVVDDFKDKVVSRGA